MCGVDLSGPTPANYRQEIPTDQIIDPRHPSQYPADDTLPFPSPTAEHVMKEIHRVKDLVAMANDEADVAAEAEDFLRGLR